MHSVRKPRQIVRGMILMFDTGYMFVSAITDENDMLELSYGQLDRCVCVRHEDVKGLQEQVVESGKVDSNCNVI